MKNLPQRDRRAQRSARSPYAKYGKKPYRYSNLIDSITESRKAGRSCDDDIAQHRAMMEREAPLAPARLYEEDAL